MRMSRTLLVSLPIVCAVYGSLAAQTFPSKPITVVIPFPAGGPTDVIARMLGDQMRAVAGAADSLRERRGCRGEPRHRAGGACDG